MPFKFLGKLCCSLGNKSALPFCSLVTAQKGSRSLSHHLMWSIETASCSKLTGKHCNLQFSVILLTLHIFTLSHTHTHSSHRNVTVMELRKLINFLIYQKESHSTPKSFICKLIISLNTYMTTKIVFINPRCIDGDTSLAGNNLIQWKTHICSKKDRNELFISLLCKYDQP